MSDSFDDIVSMYQRDVLPDYPRHIGLFPIPEYPEDKAQDGMWSHALEVILTTLRYLAPATLLTLFWGQPSFLFRILKHIDEAVRAIVFSSDEQKASILKWLEEVGAVRVEQLDTVWRHGWVLCRVLDAALPGACAGHPPNRQTLKHAQTIADHYLGVDPVFSNQELESNDCLSRHQEWKLATYLDRIREALKKIPPPVSKPNSQRTSPMETTSLTFDYAARGSGLTAAQVNNKMFFKIYPTAQQSLEPGEITILIRGPKDTYGMAHAPPVLGKAQKIRQKLLKLHEKPSFTENMLPITQGATYLRTYGRNDMYKTYHIPKTKYDIEIEVEPLDDYVKIGYIVSYEGRYEISIISKGQGIVGSPFNVTASKNIVSFLERDSFCLEDGEEIDIIDAETDKKIVLRIVDFVTEKMLLREDGALEKISDEDVNQLLGTENINKTTKSDLSQKCDDITLNENTVIEVNKFKEVAIKITKMNRICKIFNHIKKDAEAKKLKQKTVSKPHHPLGIPDVVNSTFSDINSYTKQDNFNNIVKFGDTPVSTVKDNIKRFSEMRIAPLEAPKVLEIEKTNDFVKKPPSPNNPFVDDVYAESRITEMLTDSPYYEETNVNDEIPIQIFVEEDNTTPNTSPCTNPFIEPELMERPKTPILKIINGDLKDREIESVYVDPHTQKIQEEILRNNEFVNPFFIHKHHQSTDDEDEDPKADFLIGAPVSMPPMVRVPSPEPMTSLMITAIDESFYTCNQNQKVSGKEDEVSSSIFSTPVHTRTEQNTNISSTFHSLDSILECTEETSSDNNENNLNQCEIQVLNTKRSYETPKKDVWDSAYVSIDESNSSPDSNNNDNENSKGKSVSEGTPLRREELLKMGPAELELWTTCAELTSNEPKVTEEVKLFKWDNKRPIFTPIIEENDRSISAGLNTPSKLTKHCEADPVTEAFAELNDIFQEYNSNSEQSSLTISYDDKIGQSSELEYPIEENDVRVESASDTADVTRPTTAEEEGAISEVQHNVTESVSASRIPQSSSESDQSESPDSDKKTQTQFGENKLSNIVLEKKKYWDEKIRQIEETKLEEPERKRLISKKLRHNDSLSKRRGKQMMKKIFTSSDQNSSTGGVTDYSRQFKQSFEEEHADPKLVERRKKFWDEKLETEEKETQMFRAKSPKSKEHSLSASPQSMQNSSDDVIAVVKDNSSQDNKIETSPPPAPAKQELPEEELYKAFETSPKRFFGTSRKQILNKIDSFLGKPSTAVESSPEESGASQEKGIVSSRVSLFHNITQVEDVPWKRGKSHSMHSIGYNPNGDRKRFNSLTAHSTSDMTESDVDGKPDYSINIIDEIKSNEPLTDITLKKKKPLLKSSSFHSSFDDGIAAKKVVLVAPINSHTNKSIKDTNTQSVKQQMFSKIHSLRKSSVSKSEMDIFNKSAISLDDDLDKRKSYDELPKINVKNFISMYESVTETAKAESTPKFTRMSSLGSSASARYCSNISATSGADKLSCNHLPKFEDNKEEKVVTDTPKAPPRRKRYTKKAMSRDSLNTFDSMDSLEEFSVKLPRVTSQEKSEAKVYVSLSDIEIEIVNSPDLITSSPEHKDPTDYKSRFKLAKQYFQSIEELRTETTKPAKLNECEKLLYNTTIESPPDSPQKKAKKGIKKSHSMPSSELSKIWKQMNTENEARLVKISEKFNVDDLFTDVMDGKLSRQGSLRGIPHRKAVLEAFKSMENVADAAMSSYEIAMNQLTEFAKDNQIKNAQTYLTEYPYLPTTEPSKYHSRLDAKATGLISMKELLENKPRRNSVPDLRLNPSFTVEL